ncbi:MAG: hypothetical protein ACKVQW_00700 [Pyrinomonadaceae bacterium]
MSITEIEAAITKLPVEKVGDLMLWLENYHNQLWDKQITEDLDAGRIDSIIAEAYASGEPTPLTKDDINEARRVVKDRIAARNSTK